MKLLRNKWDDPVYGDLVQARIGNIAHKVKTYSQAALFPSTIYVGWSQNNEYLHWHFIDENGYIQKTLIGGYEQKNILLITETADRTQICLQYAQECRQLYVLKQSVRVDSGSMQIFTRHDL